MPGEAAGRRGRPSPLVAAAGALQRDLSRRRDVGGGPTARSSLRRPDWRMGSLSRLISATWSGTMARTRWAGSSGGEGAGGTPAASEHGHTPAPGESDVHIFPTESHG